MKRKRRLWLELLEHRWTPAELVSTFLPNPLGPQTESQFGFAVAMSSDFRVVGAPNSDVDGLQDVGQVFVFDALSNSPILTLNNPTRAPFDLFGTSAAISGSIVVVGANQDDDAGLLNTGSAYVYDLSSPTPETPIITINNPTPAANDQFGFSVGISGNRVVIAAPLDDTGAIDGGTAYVFDLGGPNPAIPIAMLSKPVAAIDDVFGIALAISANTVVIGAPRADAGATNAGAAFVFDLDATNPAVPVVILENPLPAVDDRFGTSVAVAGEIVVVGAIWDDTSKMDSGSAYIYNLKTSTPSTPWATLQQSNPAANNYFGASVAVFGNLVAVGATGDNVSGTDSGSAHVFDISSSTAITPVLSLATPGTNSQAHFGNSLALWGRLVAVGIPGYSGDVKRSGSAHVYSLDSATPSMPITVLNNATLATGRRLGTSVAASGRFTVISAIDFGSYVEGTAYVYDSTSSTPSIPIGVIANPNPIFPVSYGVSVGVSGSKVIVGALGYSNGMTTSGAAYVYDMNSPTPTVPALTIFNPSPTLALSFGYTLAISGNYVVVGAPWADIGATNAGASYVFDLGSPTPSTPIATLLNPNPAVNDFFGESVGIWGSKVVIGAPSDDFGATDAGTAYVYDVSSITPTIPIATLTNPNPSTGDSFGKAVGIAKNTVVVGASADDSEILDSGLAYVYQLESPTPSVPVLTLNRPSPGSNDRFGYSLAIDSNKVVIGASLRDQGATDAGSAFVFDLASGTPSAPIATLNNPHPAFGDQFGHAVAISGSAIVVGANLDDDQNTDQGSAHHFSLAPIRVANAKVNGGDQHRSRVTSIDVTFDQDMSFTTIPSSAFELKRQSDGQVVQLNASVAERTVTLSFAGGPVEFASLADGRYTLSIFANQVNNSNGALDGNGDGVGGDNYTFQFHRLFGDSDGNGTVTAGDFNAFRLAYSGTGMAFDFNNDGVVTALDFQQFRLRYGMMI